MFSQVQILRTFKLPASTSKFYLAPWKPLSYNMATRSGIDSHKRKEKLDQIKERERCLLNIIGSKLMKKEKRLSALNTFTQITNSRMGAKQGSLYRTLRYKESNIQLQPPAKRRKLNNGFKKTTMKTQTSENQTSQKRNENRNEIQN